MPAIPPKREAPCCFVFGNDNATEAVARFRAANWPDDGEPRSDRAQTPLGYAGRPKGAL